MKSEWKKVKLGDVLNLRRGHDLPHSDMIDGNVPVAGSSGIIGYHNRSTEISPCITVGRSGSTGETFFYQKAWAHNTTLYVDNFKGNDPLYLYYLLKNMRLGEMAGGSAVPTLNRNHIHPLEISFPIHHSTQHRIATILSRYDSLIENCRKQINLLEEAAQRLYREWFVDLRFPGHENTAIIDGVPEGWEMKKISDVCELSAGKDKPSIVENTITETCKVPVYSNGITDEGLFGYTDVPRIVCESVTISARGTIGYACLRMHPYVPIVRLLVLIPKAFVSAKFIYQWTLCKEFKGNGAAQQQLTVPLFRDEEILLPTKSLMKSFGEKEDIIFESIDNIKSHLRLLTEARDRLLPKLMSGEIDV